MLKTRFVLAATLLLGPAALAASAGACTTGTAAALCQALCTCSPCTANDIADCEASSNAADKEAAQAGCADPFNAYVGCALDNVRCRNPGSVDTACFSQVTALIKCDNTVPILGTPCEASVTKMRVCLGSKPASGGAGACTGQQACTAQCVNAATCAEVVDIFSGGAPSGVGKPLQDCLSACLNPAG